MEGHAGAARLNPMISILLIYSAFRLSLDLSAVRPRPSRLTPLIRMKLVVSFRLVVQPWQDC